ncbi:MAG: ribbon-helix-helix protein, CopG family [Armatimonadota bacterium]
MGSLSDRLEVRLPSQTLALLRKEAERRSVSMGRLVREAIDLLLLENRQARIRAAEALFQVGAPVADWPKMKREIEAAHIEGTRR